MGGLSIDGLVTGLDTASIIKQLLAVERAPAQPARGQEGRHPEVDRRLPGAQHPVHRRPRRRRQASAAPSTGTTAPPSRATTSSSAPRSPAPPAPGSMTFSVTALAATHTLVSGNSYAADTDAASPTARTSPSTARSSQPAAYGSGTLDEIAAAINAADTGVTAGTVQVTPGQYRLQLTSATAGAAGAFTGRRLRDLGGFGVVTAGADATITRRHGPCRLRRRPRRPTPSPTSSLA